VAGGGGGQDAAVVAAGEREPGPHFLCPGHHLGVTGFLAEAPCRLPGGFSGGAVGGVVLDATNQRGEPARHGEQFGVLAEGELAVQHGGDPAQP
jgi:hypothetical protein